MKQGAPMRHEFVEFVPELADMNEGTLYVALVHATTVVHLCCCGCGREVVTPLSPTDWKMIFDGESVSLCPSIGNWSFPCRAHYWIRKGKVEWSGSWSKGEIAAGRERDAEKKAEHYDRVADAEIAQAEEQITTAVERDEIAEVETVEEQTANSKSGWWQNVKLRFASLWK